MRHNEDVLGSAVLVYALSYAEAERFEAGGVDEYRRTDTLDAAIADLEPMREHDPNL